MARPWTGRRMVWAVVLFALAGALACWRGLPGRQRPPDLALVELAVAGHLTPDALWREAGLPQPMGRPVDPAAVSERLRSLPAIASVERQPSSGKDRVRLLARVRQPAAVLICPAAGVGTLGSEVPMVLDRSCVAIPFSSYAGLEDQLQALPRVKLLKIPGFAPGVPLTSPALRTAMAVVAGAGSCGLGSGIREVSQLNDYSITVDFDGGPVVQFAFEDPEGQLQKLRLIQSYAERSDRKLKTVNLMLRRNIPVTFAGETADGNPGRDVQR